MKADVFLVLENAAWPALLVEGSGVIRRANQAAVDLFGPLVNQGATLLSAVWAPENEHKAEPFLSHWDRTPAPHAAVKFLVKGGAVRAFHCHLCAATREGQKVYLFQLLPEAVPVVAPSTPPPPTPAGTPAPVEAHLVQKQKLDCALKLARTVALDLNNALTGILGHTSLVLDKMEARHPWRYSLLEVEKAAEKASEITHDLAAFSWQEKEQKSLTQGNLNELLTRTTEVIRVPPAVNVIWSLQLDGQICSAQYDEAKMQQAFLKILENSVQAINGEGRIILRTRNLEAAEPVQDGATRVPPGRYVCVEVSDSGCGIPPEILPRIFEPFFTTKQKPAHRGLGLAWVYGVVTNHGGFIGVSSRAGEGTSVRVYLPALGKVARGAAFKPEELRGKETILMVDDEDLMLTLCQTVLSSYGYIVLTASSGKRAIELMNQEASQIDLVITDLVMPQLGGRELIERLRVMSGRFRVLYSSGFVRPPHSGEQGMYLQKPFTSQELVRKVREVLESAPV